MSLKPTHAVFFCLNLPLFLYRSVSSQPPPLVHSINQPQLGKYFLLLCQVHISTILSLGPASSVVRVLAVHPSTGAGGPRGKADAAGARLRKAAFNAAAAFSGFSSLQLWVPEGTRPADMLRLKKKVSVTFLASPAKKPQ